MKKFACFLSILLMTSLIFTGCGSSSSGIIKFGVVFPMTGANATLGTDQMKGMQLAMDEANAKGGVNGHKIEMITYDDTGVPAQAATGAQKFADQKDISLIFGSALSGNSMAMVPICEKAKIPQIVGSSSAANLSGISPYFFRMAAQEDKVGGAMGSWLKDGLSQGLKVQKIVIMCPNSDPGKSLNESLIKFCQANGMTVQESIFYLLTDQDFSSSITKIKTLNPDVLVLGGGNYSDSALIIKQARQSGLKTPILGGTGLFSPKFAEIGGTDVNGTYLVLNYLSSNPAPRVQNFVKKWKEKFNAEPNDKNAVGYDVMNVVLDATKRAMDANNGKLTREGLKDAIKSTNLPGVVGERVTFSAKNNWDRDYVRAQFKDGNFVAVGN